jgi:hypothetical protein
VLGKEGYSILTHYEVSFKKGEGFDAGSPQATMAHFVNENNIL